jgi:calcineurin-like phosphoesterase family protein
LKGNHDSSSWTAIREAFIQLGGKKWHLLHNPAESLSTNVICGHVHHLWKVQKIKDRIVVNVGVDVWDYKPVSINQILTAVERHKKKVLK